MDFKKVVIQAFIGALFFTLISVILEGEYSRGVWIEKGLRGLIFGVVYGVFLVVRNKFIRK